MGDQRDSAPESAGLGQSIIGEVTVEIVLDQPGHIRQPIADDEIVERAATIQAVAGREVRFLTCDTARPPVAAWPI